MFIYIKEGLAKMCWSRKSKTLSWLGILWGLLSFATLMTAFLSNVWLYTKEPVRFPNSDMLTTVTFKIGLWRICPTLKLANTTPYLPHLSCTSIKYSSWEDITATDLGIATSLEFTPLFLSKMRISTLFGAVSIILIFLATAFALVGLYNSDHKTIVACGLFILGGLTLGGGLLIFASVLSDAYFERPKRPNVIISGFEKVTPSGSFDYKYGWSFFAAGAAFFMTELAAVLSISAYMRRFPTVEDMVRIMVPGAERRLKEHGIVGEYLVQHKNKYQRQDPDTSVSVTSGPKCKSKVPLESDFKGAEEAMFLNKPAPDICASNPSALPESIISFGSSPASSKVLMTPTGAFCADPENSYVLSEIGPVGTGVDSELSKSPLRGPLAGHTVPIVLMHPPQRPPTAPFVLSAPKKDCKRNFKMSAFALTENNIKHDSIAFSTAQLISGTGGEFPFDQSFYSSQCSEFEDHLNQINFGLEHLSSELGKSEATFFGTFQGEKAFPRAGVLDVTSSDLPGTFSTSSLSSGIGSGTTASADSSQSGFSRKADFVVEKKRKKSMAIGGVFSNLKTLDSGRNQESRSFECKSSSP